MKEDVLSTISAGLFVPLSRPSLFAGAPHRGADALVFDLEDSALPAQKHDARAALGPALHALLGSKLPSIVRVNADPRWLADDVLACAAAGVHYLMVPKVDSAQQILALEPLLGRAESATGRAPGFLRLLALVESPTGLLAAASIACAGTRVEALVFGAEDYCAALGIPAQGAALDWPAQQLAVSARAAGRAALGLPGSMAGVANPAHIGRLAQRARSMGFTGCFCIHPSQLGPARAGFQPSMADIAAARAVVAAADQTQPEGGGAFLVEGRMVDAPVLLQARATLRRVDQAG